MDKEEEKRALEIKEWLQEEIADFEEEKEWLKTLLDVIDMADIQRALGSELATVLDFSTKGNVLVVRGKGFLERNIWLAVTDTVRQFNGHWISAGKDSRWEIPLEKTENMPPLTCSDTLDPLA